jgi:hypothetical protein
MFVIASEVPELSVSVMLWDALLVPTMEFPKVILVVESVAVICGGAGLLLLLPHPSRIKLIETVPRKASLLAYFALPTSSRIVVNGLSPTFPPTGDHIAKVLTN